MSAGLHPKRPFLSAESLRTSLHRQELIYRSSLTLNPVENIPYVIDLSPCASFLHGLYNSDRVRSAEEQIKTAHQFGGRRRLAYDSERVYRAFAKALRAEEVSLRLLSGLHAHAALFMAIATIGQKVLLLPELAGGHMSTKAILERLGLQTVEMIADNRRQCIDVDQTIRVGLRESPDFIFVDRSEGLVYEDFGSIVRNVSAVSVFDASQYLSNIIAGDYPNPFDVGFQLILSSLHKNFPGPQKALVATNKVDALWYKTKAGLSTYVSNMHVFSTYAAGLTLSRMTDIQAYSRRLLALTTALDQALYQQGVNVVPRPNNLPPTHHIWIRANDREHAFKMFKALERCRILVNFRLLPYRIGFGLRLGLNSAARLGMTVDDAVVLASVINDIVRNGAGSEQRRRALAFIQELWRRYETLDRQDT